MTGVIGRREFGGPDIADGPTFQGPPGHVRGPDFPVRGHTSPVRNRGAIGVVGLGLLPDLAE